MPILDQKLFWMNRKGGTIFSLMLQYTTALILLKYNMKQNWQVREILHSLFHVEVNCFNEWMNPKVSYSLLSVWESTEGEGRVLRCVSINVTTPAVESSLSAGKDTF